MMRIRFMLTLMVISSLLVIFMGCAEPPTQEMDEAKAALEAAKTAGADRYVPDMYNAAKKALDDALALVEQGDYDEAKTLLATAIETATNAANAVAGKKEEVKQEVEGMLQQIPEAVNQAKNLWKKAPRGKGTREALEMIKNDIAAAEASVAEVTSALESGDFLAARGRAQSIMKKLQSLQTELQRPAR
jgi:tetratricopeptide (TPR) repeat protein